MRIVFKKSYDRDIDLHEHGWSRAKIAVLAGIMIVLPFLGLVALSAALQATGVMGVSGQRLLTMLAILGPGLIVMVGDNDAGGVATYAQAGQSYGYSLMWVLLLLIPVLIVNQEMVVRLGAVTGVGHARLINERFGRGWVEKKRDGCDRRGAIAVLRPGGLAALEDAYPAHLAAVRRRFNRIDK